MNRLLLILILFFGLLLLNSGAVFSQNEYCGATVTTGYGCVNDGSKCVAVGLSTKFENCPCTTKIQSFTSCSATGQICLEPVYFYEPKYCRVEVCDVKCTGGGPYPVLNPENVYASDSLAACTYKCYKESVECGTTKTQVGCNRWVPSGCRENYTSLSCGGSVGSGPSCSAQSACTPTCPAGTVPYDTGSGSSAGASCTYQTGGVTNGSCTTSSVNRTCWTVPTPPVVTVTNTDATSVYNCTASSAYMGRDANNTNRVRVDFANNNGSNPYRALQVWFAQGTNTPPSINKVYATGTGDLLSNGSYGILVRNNGTSWNDIYVPGVQNGVHTWVRAGSIGSGLRAEILGSSSQKLAGIRDVTVTTNGTTVTLQFDMQYYHSDSGLTSYEQATEGLTAIHATANANSSFLPSGGDTISVVPQWFNSNRSWTLDLSNPISDKLDFVIVDTTHTDVDWKFSDAISPIRRVVGDADIANSDNPDNIDDETSGVNNYVFGSGTTGANLYGGTHLWSLNNDGDRVDRIDLNNNESGRITFTANAFDAACNLGTASNTLPFGIGWLTTKGGMLFGGSSVAVTVPTLSGNGGFSNDSYWNSPFAFIKNEADITSELVSASSSSVNNLLHPSTVGSVRSLNHFDTNNRQDYWYDELERRSDLQVAQSPNDFVVVTYSDNVTLAGNTTDISNGGNTCVGNKECVIKVAGNLTIDSNFVCNTRAVFFATGQTNIRPDVTAPNQEDGCMFVSKGDVSIKAGTYKSASSSYPVYDIIEAYMISNEKIDIPLADEDEDTRDGLLIHGSILGFGDTDGVSISLGRSLKLLHNQSYPSAALHFDNRYLGFAPMFFGGETEGFRREVGFKPL